MRKYCKYIQRVCLWAIALLCMIASVLLIDLDAKGNKNIRVNAAPTRMVGIDVSEWNQEIDWVKVKNAGVEFAIIRMFGHNKNTNTYRVDPYFERNVREAQAQGIHLGAYFFSYAPTLSDIPNEANMVMDLLSKYPGVFSFPIVFDAEDGDYTDDPNVEGEDIYDIGPFAGQACNTFCTMLRENGYYPMVYSYDWYFESKIGMANVKDFDLWQASYPRISGSTTQIYAGTGPSYINSVDDSKRTKLSAYDSNVTMWQYTGAGKIEGINAGDGGAIVDMNVCYVDYTQIIPAGGYNGYGDYKHFSVDEDSIKESSLAGGSGIPKENHNHSNPNVHLQGFSESVNHYKGLENYGDNKEKVLINGRSWSKWEELFGEDVLKNLWVYGAGSGNAYLGIEIKDNTRLYLREYGGSGEAIDTIVLKRGFQIVNPSSNLWDSDEISSSTDVNVVGVLDENIILVANNKGGFNVVEGIDASMSLDGYTISDGSNGVEINARNREYLGYNKYTIVKAELNTDNSHNGQLAVKLLNNTNESMSSIDLGYAWQGWSSIDTNNAFLTHVKVNGAPIKEVYPEIKFWALETGNGIAFEGMELTSGDVVTIERGATFVHGDIQMEMGYQYNFTYNGSTYEIAETSGTESVGSGEFLIVKVRLYGDGNTTDKQIAIKFMNDENEDASTVDLGYRKNGWTPIGNEDSFLDSIKVNGTPIKEVFPSVVLCALDTGCGLALQNVAMKVGDILSIDEGAQFTHGGFSMTMYQRFAFRYDGATYEIRDAFLDEVDNRSYKIVAVSAYEDDNCTEQNLAFKLLSHTDERYSNVNLGYPFSWTNIGTDNSFLSYVKVNGEPVVEKCPNLVFYSMDTGYSLSLQGLGLSVGDQVTIDKGAVFTNGDITAKMMQGFTFTFNGTGYDVSATEDSVNEFSIVRVSLYGDGNTDNTKIAVKFMNNENESASTVDLGCARWTELGTKIAFIDSIKINGQPIKEVYPSVAFWALDTGCGLALQGLDLQDGDVITIEQGAIFAYNDVSMQMQFEFQFAYENGEFDVYRVNAPKIDVPPAQDEDSSIDMEDSAMDSVVDGDVSSDTQSSGTVKKTGCRASVGGMGLISCCIAGILVAISKAKKANEQKRSR